MKEEARLGLYGGKNIAGPLVALESSNSENLILRYGFFKKRPGSCLHHHPPGLMLHLSTVVWLMISAIIGSQITKPLCNALPNMEQLGPWDVSTFISGTTDISSAFPKGSINMKTILIAMGILAATAASAFAAEPAKMMDTKMGKVLVNEKSMTLYTFDKDAKGKSSCDKDCLKMWPAFHTDGKAKAAGEWSIVKASDGKDMWAYSGKSLYTYSKDMKSGDTNGDGVGGVWHIAK